MRTRLLLAAATAALVALPGAASAAPVAVGPGTLPSVQMDPAGNAFIGYLAPGEVANLATVCVLPLRAKTCNPLGAVPAFGPEGATVKQLRLLRRPTDGALVLVASVFLAGAADESGMSVWSAISGDGGAGWSVPVQIGTGQPDIEDAALTADGLAVDLIGGDPSTAQFSRLPLTGPPLPSSRDLRPSEDDIVTGQSIVSLPGGGALTGFKFSRWGLARLAPGADPVTAFGPWQRAGRVDASEGDQVLATGPRGVYALARRFILTQIKRDNSPLLLRRVGSKRVGKGTRVGRGFTNEPPALAQDPAGGLHVVWENFPSRTLQYTRTRGERGRCSFGAQTRQTTFGDDLPVRLRIAASSPKAVVVVYDLDGSGIKAISLRGGNTPKPRKKQNC